MHNNKKERNDVKQCMSPCSKFVACHQSLTYAKCSRVGELAIVAVHLLVQRINRLQPLLVAIDVVALTDSKFMAMHQKLPDTDPPKLSIQALRSCISYIHASILYAAHCYNNAYTSNHSSRSALRDLADV